MKEEPKISDETVKSFPKYDKKSFMDSFPPHLKDHENYDKIQRALLDALSSSHSHSDVQEWAACVKCQRKLEEHKMLMLSLGFKTPAHYMVWKRIHEQIKTKKRDPLPKYNA